MIRVLNLDLLLTLRYRARMTLSSMEKINQEVFPIKILRDLPVIVVGDQVSLYHVQHQDQV